jgi:hypothetical protein
MAGVLTLSQWLGGPDDVKVESEFPSTTRTYAYAFNTNVTGWTFKLDYQAVVVDSMTYNRDGSPNFSSSKVIGSFPYGVVDTSTYIIVMNTASGIVNVTHPASLYTGPIIPDARVNNPLLVMSFTWTDNQSPKQTNTHRIAKIMAWEPQVVVGDPTTSTNYSALIVNQ